MKEEEDDRGATGTLVACSPRGCCGPRVPPTTVAGGPLQPEDQLEVDRSSGARGVVLELASGAKQPHRWPHTSASPQQQRVFSHETTAVCAGGATHQVVGAAVNK